MKMTKTIRLYVLCLSQVHLMIKAYLHMINLELILQKQSPNQSKESKINSKNSKILYTSK